MAETFVIQVYRQGHGETPYRMTVEVLKPEGDATKYRVYAGTRYMIVSRTHKNKLSAPAWKLVEKNFEFTERDIDVNVSFSAVCNQIDVWLWKKENNR